MRRWLVDRRSKLIVALLFLLAAVGLGFFKAPPRCSIPLISSLPWVAPDCVSSPNTETNTSTVNTAPVPLQASEKATSNNPIRETVFLGQRENGPVMRGEVGFPWQLLLAPLLGGLLGYLSVYLSGPVLRRDRSRIPTTSAIIDKIAFHRLPPLFFVEGYDERLAGLHYRNETGNRLDIDATINATVQRGLPMLAHRSRQRRAEFVLVHAQRHRRDWQRGYFSTLAAELVDHGVLISRYTYSATPGRLQPASGGSLLGLEQAMQQHRTANWVIAVSDDSLLHPMVDKLFPWTESMQLIHRHCLLHFGISATARRLVGQSELVAHQIGDLQSFNSLFGRLSGTGANQTAAPRAYPVLPARLESLGSPHRMYDPPPANQIQQLIRWLQQSLPAGAFRLLCASVVYPIPDWRISLLLAERLAGGDQWHSRDAIQHGSTKLLAPLLQLPWPQHSHYPEWLREALINELSDEQERTIGNLFMDLLGKAKDQDSIDPLEIRIDQPDWSIASWYARATGNSPMQDGLFASVLDSNRMAFRHLPKTVSRAIRRRQLAPGSWWKILQRIASGAVAMLLLSTMLWQFVGQDWQQQQAIEQQCTAHAAMDAVQIYSTAATAAEAQTLGKALASHCFNVEQLGVKEDTRRANTIHAPQSVFQTIAEIADHTLYNLDFTGQLSEDRAQVFLYEPLLSGQVFRDRFASAAIEPDIELTSGTITQTSDAENPIIAPVPEPATGPSIKAIEPELISIPAGRFVMGSYRYGVESERPEHEVIMAAFSLAAKELSWREWQRCELAGACAPLVRPEWRHIVKQPDYHPVVRVSWDEANLYIAWLNSVTDGGYRLPSEAEWEYAARAGTQTPFNTGECMTAEQANFDHTVAFEKCPTAVDFRGHTDPVASYPANLLGLYDMHGNVWEWVQDCWNENYADNPPLDGSAWLAGECGRRVLRGGSWDDYLGNLRSTVRKWDNREVGDISVGFRLARTP